MPSISFKTDDVNGVGFLVYYCKPIDVLHVGVNPISAMKHTFALYMLCHKSTRGFATFLTFTYIFIVHHIYLHFVFTSKTSLWVTRKKFATKFPTAILVFACLFNFKYLSDCHVRRYHHDVFLFTLLDASICMQS